MSERAGELRGERHQEEEEGSREGFWFSGMELSWIGGLVWMLPCINFATVPCRRLVLPRRLCPRWV